jgi:endonuclease YncB( thermonuclease family)
VIRTKPVVLSLVVAVVAASVLSACEKAPDLPSSIDLQPQGLGDRVRVLSADAMVIDGKHVRLANAYGPQGVPDARCWAEATAAQTTLAWVRAKMRDAREIAIEPVTGFDEFHRQMAIVIVDGVDLGQEMYQSGLAARRSDGPNGRFAWCEPISGKAPGAPAVSSLLD